MGRVTESSTSRSTGSKKSQALELTWDFETPKPTPNDTFSNKVTLSNPSAVVPLPNDQAFLFKSPQPGTFERNKHYLAKENKAAYCGKNSSWGPEK